MSRNTQRPDQSPEPTALALSVPLSRFTPRVGGGSAFFVRPLDDILFVMKMIAYCALLLMALLIVSGCKVVRDQKVELNGSYCCLATNSDCIIRLTTPLSWEAGQFEIDFFKKDSVSHMSVDWMQASYQYEKNPVHSLNMFRNYDLKRFGTATYIPTDDALVLKPEVGNGILTKQISDGHYKIFVEYVLSGSAQTNTCSFDFLLKIKKTTQLEPTFGPGSAPGG